MSRLIFCISFHPNNIHRSHRFWRLKLLLFTHTHTYVYTYVVFLFCSFYTKRRETLSFNLSNFIFWKRGTGSLFRRVRIVLKSVVSRKIFFSPLHKSIQLHKKKLMFYKTKRYMKISRKVKSSFCLSSRQIKWTIRTYRRFIKDLCKYKITYYNIP